MVSLTRLVITDILANPFLWDDPLTSALFCFIWHGLTRALNT
jgi:hypothetical protein